MDYLVALFYDRAMVGDRILAQLTCILSNTKVETLFSPITGQAKHVNVGEVCCGVAGRQSISKEIVRNISFCKIIDNLKIAGRLSPSSPIQGSPTKFDSWLILTTVTLVKFLCSFVYRWVFKVMSLL